MQILTVASRVIQQVIKDKRTLVFLLLAPVFVLGLLYFIMDSASDEPVIGAVDLDDSFQDALQEEAMVKDYDSREKALDAMKAQKIDAYFYVSDDKPHIKIEGGDMSKRSLVI